MPSFFLFEKGFFLGNMENKYIFICQIDHFPLLFNSVKVITRKGKLKL